MNYEVRVFYGSLSLFARLGLKFAASRGFCSKINEIELDVHSGLVSEETHIKTRKKKDSSRNGPTCFQKSWFDFGYSTVFF